MAARVTRPTRWLVRVEYGQHPVEAYYLTGHDDVLAIAQDDQRIYLSGDDANALARALNKLVKE